MGYGRTVVLSGDGTRAVRAHPSSRNRGCHLNTRQTPVSHPPSAGGFGRAVPRYGYDMGTLFERAKEYDVTVEEIERTLSEHRDDR